MLPELNPTILGFLFGQSLKLLFLLFFCISDLNLRNSSVITLYPLLISFLMYFTINVRMSEYETDKDFASLFNPTPLSYNFNSFSSNGNGFSSYHSCLSVLGLVLFLVFFFNLNSTCHLVTASFSCLLNIVVNPYAFSYLVSVGVYCVLNTHNQFIIFCQIFGLNIPSIFSKHQMIWC